MNLFQQQQKNPKTTENNNVMIPFRVFFAFKIHFGINEEVCFWIQEFLSLTAADLFSRQSLSLFSHKRKIVTLTIRS